MNFVDLEYLLKEDWQLQNSRREVVPSPPNLVVTFSALWKLRYTPYSLYVKVASRGGSQGQNCRTYRRLSGSNDDLC